MSILNPQLRKLLKFLALDGRRLDSEIRKDIRESNQDGCNGGGDFYSPFWKDVKDYVAGRGDLIEMTEARVAANRTRQRLYPAYARAFLMWAADKRRLTNLPVQLLDQSAHGRFTPEGIKNSISVGGLMCIRIGADRIRLIYPYYYEKPALPPEVARLGLWAMSQALSDENQENLRILDVLRSRSYSIEELGFIGDENEKLRSHYQSVLARRDQLLEEYD